MSKFDVKRYFDTPNEVPEFVVSYVSENWITAEH